MSPSVSSKPGPGSQSLAELFSELQLQGGVPEGQLVVAIEAAVAAAWHQDGKEAESVVARIDRSSGSLSFWKVNHPLGDEGAVGPDPISIEGHELVGWSPVAVPDRVLERAVRLARAAIGRMLRDARRERLEEEASYRRWQLADGIVEQVRDQTVYLRTGALQAYLPPSEQIKTDRLHLGEHLKVVLLEPRLSASADAVQIRASRTSPLLLRRLLEGEVPEIAEGSVAIRAIAREPGRRSKVAVASAVAEIDAKGACIGPRGVRIRAVVSELRGETVDIIEWSGVAAEFVGRALAPAEVRSVSVEPAARKAVVAVAQDQLTLAIGAGGQNARLAARLTGWRVDIRAEPTAG